ncbi:MAG: restriction endonuclease [Herpetosiphonaceae bacterium]|nr:restriction endonuclease [Herpetosiphonaceae bacterium]
MAVPDFQSIMLPLLRFTADQEEHTLDQAYAVLSKQFSLTDDERKELLPSGRQSRFENRTGWSRTYLTKAALLEATGRAKFRITKRGLEVLRTNPPSINIRSLMQFPEFAEFKQPTARANVGSERQDIVDEATSQQTPQELLDTSYQTLRQSLAEDILDLVKASPPRFFEILVVDLLVAMGYGGSRKDAGQAVGQTGDGGIDGIIKEDRLGLEAIYIQAKRWEGSVGRPVIQAFAGSLEGQKARKGVFITTSRFSPDAKDYITRIEKKIVLIDGEQLAQLMIDYGVGVTEVGSYIVKRINSDYFGEE